jgi:uncharacterized protein YbbC (DUF1343 family)
MSFRLLLLVFSIIWTSLFSQAKVQLGVDVFFQEPHKEKLKGKRLGLITNHTGMNGSLKSTIDLFLENSSQFTLAAIFCPEHGLSGIGYAAEKIEHFVDKNIPIYSLHGDSRRPSAKMLKEIEVLVYDIQETGVRAYTYASTLFYAMEEAAAHKIPVVVFDRPNPLSGLLVDGPMMKDKFRSFVGYVNVPYCHGMTIGELALFFNEEYKIGCDLMVVPMKGWERKMSFNDTGLTWIPTSPYVPEPDTPFYSATTGIMGELELVNIGIGYTLPFKLVGAPWINGEDFAKQLNAQNFPGVYFIPFAFRPFYGLYKGKDCHGVKIVITDYAQYKPLSVQYLLLGMLKTLYPKEIESKLREISHAKAKFFSQINGNDEFFEWLKNEKYIAWKFIEFQKEERDQFLPKREKYLLYK